MRKQSVVETVALAAAAVAAASTFILSPLTGTHFNSDSRRLDSIFYSKGEFSWFGASTIPLRLVQSATVLSFFFFLMLHFDRYFLLLLLLLPHVSFATGELGCLRSSLFFYLFLFFFFLLLYLFLTFP